jgi:hypothetical protein
MVSSILQESLVSSTATTDLVLCMLLLILSEKKLRNHQQSKNIGALNSEIIIKTYFSIKVDN